MNGYLNEVEEAFADSRLWVEVDAPTPGNDRAYNFSGCERVPHGTKLQFVHVMSKPAGGEIRGYVLVEGDTTLRLRGPYYNEWPEMDEAVMARTGATSVSVGRSAP